MCIRTTEKTMLKAIVKVQTLLLKNHENDAMWNKVMSVIGNAANISRVYLFRNKEIDGELYVSQKYEWCNTGIKSFISDESMQGLPWIEFSPNIYDHMLNKKSYQNLQKDYDAFEQAFLIPQSIKSILLIPIYIGTKFYGLLGFDDCKIEDYWDDSEINFLKTVVNSIAIFIKHKKSQELEKESDIKYDIMLNLFPFPVMAYELNGDLKFINKKAVSEIKLPIKKILSMNMIDFFPKEDKKLRKLMKDRLLSNYEGTSQYKNKFPSLESGTDFEITTKIISQKNAANYKISIIRDISESVNKTRELKESIIQKGIIIKEMHHRIKNNLSVVQGLLDIQMQSELAELDPLDITQMKLKTIINDAKRRILSISLIHKLFYDSSSDEGIDFNEFLIELLNYLDDMFYMEKKEKEIKIIFDSEKVLLCLDQSVPCGLIVNEIIANAYKYAFVGKDTGIIKILLRSEDEDYFKLEIEDDGIGLPVSYSEETLDDTFGNSTLGFSLIRGLTSQMYGKFGFTVGDIKADGTREPGTKFSLRIPKRVE